MSETRVVHSFEELGNLGDCAVAIGFYDGVHVGHQRLVKALVAEATRRSLAPVILTFANHPATVVRPEAVPPLLTSTDRRVELLCGLGAEVLCVARFDRELSQWTPRQFCEEVLCQRAHARLLMVGQGFVLGRNRSGPVPVLEALGAELGFEVRPFESVRVGDTLVSSSRLRDEVAAGHVERARQFLGRPHRLTSTRVSGHGVGRQLGFPTVNLELKAAMACPAPGIYAGRAHFGSRQFGTAIYLGRRATFGGGDVAFEVHLLDTDRDPGGESASVDFLRRVRGDRKFDTVEALVEQIGKDVAQVRNRLRSEDH